MVKAQHILFVLIFIFFIGYLPDFFSQSKTFGFPFADRLDNGRLITMNRQWYVLLLVEKIRYVVLSWALWFYSIPKGNKLLRLGAAIICVQITFVPINWVLFYMAPFRDARFILTILLSIGIGFFITYFNGGMLDRNNTDSGSS